MYKSGKNPIKIGGLSFNEKRRAKSTTLKFKKQKSTFNNSFRKQKNKSTNNMAKYFNLKRVKRGIKGLFNKRSTTNKNRKVTINIKGVQNINFNMEKISKIKAK